MAYLGRVSEKRQAWPFLKASHLHQLQSYTTIQWIIIYCPQGLAKHNSRTVCKQRNKL